MERRTERDGNVSATVDFAGSETVSIENQPARTEAFDQGATWALKKLAAWLEATNLVASDELAQRDVDETKMLIADQARQAAANLWQRPSSRSTTQP